MYQTVYIVQRFHWAYYDNWDYLENDIPVKAFVHRSAAEAYKTQLEEQEREHYWECNPFQYFGPLSCITSLSDEDFISSLKEAGLPIPSQPKVEGNEDFRFMEDDWWQAFDAALSPENREWVWSLLDYIRFFEVVPVEIES